MRKTISSFLLLISALSIATGVRAQSKGAYLGVGAGSSNASFNSNDFSLGLPGVAESADKTSTGGKAFAGLRFNRNLEAEVSYVNLGKFKYSYSGAPATGSAVIDYKVSGFAVSVVPMLPVSEEFSLFGRVGGFGSTAKASVSSATGPAFAGLAGFSDSANKTTFYFGAGAQYDSFRRIGVRVEYENYGEVGDSNSVGRVKVSLISASLVFRFQ